MDYTACIEEEYGFCGMEYYQVICVNIFIRKNLLNQ